MKKRILSLILALAAAAGLSAPAYARDVNGVLIEQKAQLQISGELTTDAEVPKNVTLTVYDSEDKMVFADQQMTKSVYLFKATLEDISKSYTYSLNVDGVNVNSTVSRATASNSVSYGIKLYNYVKSTELEVVFDNPYGLGETEIDGYKPLLAYYAADGKMLDCDSFDGGDFEFTKDSMSFEALPPEGTAEIKAFLWNNAVELKPHTEAVTREKGGTTVFFGDSNTHNGFWTKHVANYYLTRYPGSEMLFVNSGQSGTTATQGLDRLEWDVLSENPDRVIICYGTNDIGYNLYAKDSTATETEKQEKIDKCLESTETMISRLLEKDIEVVLMTPFAMDDGDYGSYNTVDVMPGANDALKKLGEGYKGLAEKYNIKLVDAWKITNEVTEKSREKYGSDMYVLYPDRIHLNPEGSQAVMYQYVKDMGLSQLVASVSIDASNGTVSSENAEAELVGCTSSGVEYKYLAGAIPLAATSDYKKAAAHFDGMSLSDINREIIKVTGLDDGTYTVSYDGTKVLECTAAELAEGINIAENEKNPAQLKAQKVSEYLWASDVSAMRKISSIKKELYNLGYLNDYVKIKNLPSSDKKTDYLNWTELEKAVMRNVLDAADAAKPQEYTVKIEKKN